MLLHLGIGGHDDYSTKLLGSHKPCYDGQWQLTGHYFNPNLGRLFKGPFWSGGEGGGGKITPCLKLIRVMLESWNLVRKYTYTYVVSENMPFGTKAFLILLMLTFFLQKISVFLAMIVPLFKAVLWELC